MINIFKNIDNTSTGKLDIYKKTIYIMHRYFRENKRNNLRIETKDNNYRIDMKEFWSKKQ